jgi:hypothetical protein
MRYQSIVSFIATVLFLVGVLPDAFSQETQSLGAKYFSEDIENLISKEVEPSVEQIRIRYSNQVDSVQAKLVLGRKIVGASCRASELQLLERAIALLELGFEELDGVVSNAKASSDDKSSALSAKAYAYDFVLHDHLSAMAAATKALELDPNNLGAKRIIDANSKDQAMDRIYGRKIKHIVSGYTGSNIPAIGLGEESTRADRITVNVVPGGRFKVEYSTNLTEWVDLWEGYINEREFKLPKTISASPQGFYRVTSVPNTAK